MGGHGSESAETLASAAGGPQPGRAGRPGWGRGEALGQDADLGGWDLAECCSFETKRVRSCTRKRDDHRDGEMA